MAQANHKGATGAGQRLTISDAARALRAEATRRGVSEGNRILNGPTARRIRELAADGRIDATRVNGRYYIVVSEIPRVADMLGLAAPASTAA